jgi:ADP-heptose:LPS heptosyltransferase
MLLGFMDSIGYLFRSPSQADLPSDIKKILVSRIDHLGDVLIASSILPSLKRAYPHSEIHFLMGEWSDELVRHNPWIDKAIIYNSFVHSRTGGLLKRIREDIRSFFSAVRKVRRGRYDLGLDLRAYPFNSIPIMYMAGVKYKVGFSTGGFSFLLDRIVPYRTGVHETEHLKDLLKQLDIVIKEDEVQPFFPISEIARIEAEKILCGVGLNPDERFVLVHTDSGNPRKLWITESWQELIESIQERWGIKILVYECKNKLTHCFKLPPTLPLDAFASIMKKATLFIGLDSFPAHLAGTVGTPAVVIWCDINDHVQWCPLGGKAYLVRKHPDGASTLGHMTTGVDEVMKGVEALMPHENLY